MKNRYFEISDGVLNVLQNISPRSIFNGFGIILLIIYMVVLTTITIAYTVNGYSIVKALSHIKDPFMIIFFNFIPLAALVIAPRLPPAAKVSFHYDTKTVKWILQEYSLEVPFEKIHFRTDLILSKSGMSSIGVAVSAIDSNPLFSTDPPKKDPNDKYTKVLWGFYCESQAEADEMIEIIKIYMDGKLDGSPSKFDDL